MTYVPGPFSSNHLYLQWGGLLPGGDEWSCGLRIAPTNPPANTTSYDDNMLNAVAAAVQAYHVAGLISVRCLLTFAKLNTIDVNGKYLEPVTHEHVFANVPGTGQDGRTQPNQIALAVSLTTGVSRGPAHRGRFFMPLPCTPAQQDGRILAGDQTFAHDTSWTFIQAVNAAVGANQKVSVMSRRLGTPAARVVTGVQVGRVLDTQRRRRNKLAESY